MWAFPARGTPLLSPIAAFFALYGRSVPKSEVRIPIMSGFPLNSLSRS